MLFVCFCQFSLGCLKVWWQKMKNCSVSCSRTKACGQVIHRKALSTGSWWNSWGNTLMLYYSQIQLAQKSGNLICQFSPCNEEQDLAVGLGSSLHLLQDEIKPCCQSLCPASAQPLWTWSSWCVWTLQTQYSISMILQLPQHWATTFRWRFGWIFSNWKVTFLWEHHRQGTNSVPAMWHDDKFLYFTTIAFISKGKFPQSFGCNTGLWFRNEWEMQGLFHFVI